MMKIIYIIIYHLSSTALNGQHAATCYCGGTLAANPEEEKVMVVMWLMMVVVMVMMMVVIVVVMVDSGTVSLFALTSDLTNSETVAATL